MIGLLDPALLLPRNGPSPDADFCAEINEIIRMCRRYNIRLVPIGTYWRDLWSTLGRDLEKALNPEAKKALQELRKQGNQHGPIEVQVDAVAWRRGFKQLFGKPPLPDDWEIRMAAAAAVAASLDPSVVVFVRRVEGRNLVIHRAGNSTLDENTRWVLYVQVPGKGTIQIPCIYNGRNLTTKWTCRFDWRLPSDGKYPFVPPTGWWKGSTVAFRTIQGKHAWIDGRGSGWARPNIPGGSGYHWDVLIQNQLTRQRIGSEHINIVAFNVPQHEGHPGQIHHATESERNRINDVGWE